MKKKTIIVLTILAFLAVAGFTTVHQIISTYGSVSPIVGKAYVYSLNSYSNLYCRFYNTQKDQLWDTNATDLGSAATVTWANSAVSLTDHTSTRGGWLIAVPTSANLDEGWYDIVIYDNGTPASSDAVLLGRHCYIKGNNIQSLDDL